MEAFREARGFHHLAYGMNLDDRAPGQAEFRPGQQAAALHKAVAPLVVAHLSKTEIRSLARERNLRIWDKPASACLASRVEYGRPVTRETLSQLRVRHHGDLARIEISRDELPRALSLDALDRITGALKPLGFLYVTLDTQGYRSGSMNEMLPVSTIAAATR
jgi:uncharacterized protein